MRSRNCSCNNCRYAPLLVDAFRCKTMNCGGAGLTTVSEMVVCGYRAVRQDGSGRWIGASKPPTSALTARNNAAGTKQGK